MRVGVSLRISRTYCVVASILRFPLAIALVTVVLWVGGVSRGEAQDGDIGRTSSGSSVITLTIPPRLSVHMSPTRSQLVTTAAQNLQVTSNMGDVGYSLRRVEWQGVQQIRKHSLRKKQPSNIEVVTYIVVPEE